MKKIWLSIPLLFMIPFIPACQAQMSESISDPKKGLNGSFEHVQNNLPVNWLVYTPKTTGTGNFNFYFDTVDAKDGKQSLCIDVKSCSEKGGRYSPGISQEIPIIPGKEYIVSCWVKNKNATFNIRIHGVNAKQKSDGVSLKSSENINEWRKLEWKVIVPEPMERLRIEITVTKPGTFWVENIVVH